MLEKNYNRLAALERSLTGKPCLRIIYLDGTREIVPSGRAIDLVKTRASDIAKIESVRGRNGMLPDLILALCEREVTEK